MKIPVYVVTGFLDSGKTTFLNTLLNRSDWRDVKILLIQFESGEEEFAGRHGNVENLRFPKKALEGQPQKIVEEIADCVGGSLSILKTPFDEIWIEWNGTVPFSRLQDLLLQPSLRELCQISKVIHIADAAKLESLLGKTGGALPEQIASSDFAVVRGVRSAGGLAVIKRLLHKISPGIPTYAVKMHEDVYRQLCKKKEPIINVFFLTVLVLIVLYLFAKPILELAQIPVNKIVNVFLGIILQAVPFLLIGVLLSSAIEIFVSKSAIERRFPKTFGLGMLVAILAGFCLPVCDCASIPIFRSLVKKGIPLPVAVTFMTATPVINPVVILSTYYAISGNMRIVVGRVCLGIVSAVLIGLVFAVRPPKEHVLSGGTLDRLMCSCGYYEDIESVTTFRGKIDLFFRHAQADFFNVGKYLVIGTFVSSVFQAISAGAFTSAQSGSGLIASIILMMLMGFVLSLCSSSDAVVARSFAGQFPTGALMGFLVFGPMMDIKNAMMLSSGFSKRFIVRLTVTAFIMCFTVVFLFSGLGGF
jgi:uncharacterized membrane protein YraQ (UPF0718 family)